MTDPPVRTEFSGETRLRALEVLGDTDTWTGSDWQRAATLLASAIVSVSGDLDKVAGAEITTYSPSGTNEFKLFLETFGVKPDGWPDTCARCGGPWTTLSYDYAQGFNCRECGGSDSDE